MKIKNFDSKINVAEHVTMLMCLLFLFSCDTKELLKFSVDSVNSDRLDCPVFAPLTSQEFDDAKIQLVEFIESIQKPIPFQFDENKNKLWFILDGLTPKNTKRHFALLSKSKNVKTVQIEILKKEGGLQLIFEKYKKSGFLHPVWSPGGEILTRIQAPDHYHHYGIWGP